MSILRVASVSLCLTGLVCAGCSTDVTRTTIDVLVDNDGIAHIYASSDEDAFYGAGYQMAVDRLFQMDMTRRSALGRQAEVLGATAYEDDRLARLFRWRDAGRADAARFKVENPGSYALVASWVEGVNRRIREVLDGKAPLPHGFGPAELDYKPELWDETDPLIIAKMTGFGNDMSIDRELFATIAMRLQPAAFGAIELFRPMRDEYALPPEDRPGGMTGSFCASPEASFACRDALQQASGSSLWKNLIHRRVLGSNNAAIDGRFTDTGRPLIAGDPHQGFDMPGMFYGLHMSSAGRGGTIDVAGFSFVGVPGVSLGHTSRVMWTATSAFADVMDVWEVVEDGAGVRLGGSVLSVVERDETIVTRGAGRPAGEGDSNVETFRDVPELGMILPNYLTPVPVAQVGRVLLLGWTGYRPRPFTGLLEINRVQSIADMEAAVDANTSLNYNFIAADASGITYRVGLDVPERAVAAARQPWLVLDGEDAAAAWTGTFLPRSELPQSRATSRGWIVTANNDPFGFTDNGRFDDDPYYYGAFFDAAWRARRASSEIEKLTAQGGVTLADIQAVQLDVHENLADDLLPLLIDAYSHVPTDSTLSAYLNRPDLDALVALLTVDWDRQARRDSPGALAFHAFAHLVNEEVVKDDASLVYVEAMNMQAVYMLKIGPLALSGAYANGDQLLQGGGDLILLRALDKAAGWLTERFGGVDPAGYKLSDMHVTSFDGAFGAGVDWGSIPTDGGETTINVSPSRFYDDGGVIANQWVSHMGPLVRMTGTFADDGTPELYFNAPLGNVGQPQSPHSGDWMGDWQEGRYRRLLFRRSEVDAAVESRMQLVRE
jgi:penicillin amidase